MIRVAGHRSGDNYLGSSLTISANRHREGCIKRSYQSVTPLTCIREVASSNLGQDTDNPEVLDSFPQYLQVSVGIV
jgi:hypothetical protein